MSGLGSLASTMAAAAFAASLGVTPAQAIDPFFPGFGNNGIDVVHYDLDLDVKPILGRLDAEARLRIVALAGLTRFTLDLEGLAVSKVMIAGEPAGFSQAEGKLTVTPRRAVAKGDVFDLAVTYGGKPRPIQDPTTPDDPSLQLGWFKYRNAAYAVSEPVGASTFFPANDEPTDKATFTIAVTVPAEFTAAANGALVSTQAMGDRKRFVWQMRDPMTTWLATVHVNRFRVALSHTPDGTLLRLYTTRATPAEDVKGYARVRAMIPYFESLIGPYPFDAYGSVVVDDPALYYALETQAMVTFPLGAADEGIVAHELAHQWFGDSVSVVRWADLWIAEGAATYFEVLWPNRDDPAGFDREMHAIYDYVVDKKLGPAVVDTPEEIFSDSVYLRGAATLYALRQKVGDKTFLRIIRRFNAAFRGGNATSADFIRTAETVSGDGSVRKLLHGFLYAEEVPPLPGETQAGAARRPAAPPDLVGLRCGRGSHRGAAARCAGATAAFQ